MNPSYLKALPQSVDKVDSKEFRKAGEVLHVRTNAGPIVRVSITSIFKGGFEGTIHSDDEKKVWLAGVAECEPGYISIFYEDQVVKKEDFENERWEKWIIRK